METTVAIVGTGFGGLGTAIQLGRQGITDYVVLERAGEVGGTWRDNRYPGCACDVPSHLYSFSFAPNPDWSRRYSSQPEIWDYLRRCASDLGILPHVRFHHEVRSAAWDQAACRWRIETSQGTLAASALVLATGPLSEPVVPGLPGLDRFEGPAFHSARWDPEFDVQGRRVAVIGTGASAVQMVPAIQPMAERLHLFQRTPAWVVPRPDRPISTLTRHAFRRAPAVQRLARLTTYVSQELSLVLFRHPWAMRQAQRVALRHLKKAVADPALRARLTPAYTMGCKRILLSSDYYPALAQPNVEVVTDGIAEVRGRSVLGRDGVERPVDAIIFGTGFRPTDPPLAGSIFGRGGRSLREVWAGSPKAHLGTTVAGFPNLFLLLGPNTGLGHNSVVYMSEAQIDHLVGAIRYMRDHGVGALEPRPEAQAAYVAAVDRRMRGTVWVAGGCSSWYLDGTGRNSAVWPDFSWRFHRRVARFRPEEYAVTSVDGSRT